MDNLLLQTLEHARIALEDAFSNEGDPDIPFRLVWRLERITCELAVLTGHADSLLKESPALSSTLESIVWGNPAKDDFFLEIYDLSRRTLDDAYRHDFDPDLPFRLTWNLGQIACRLAILTGHQEAFRLRFPSIKPIPLEAHGIGFDNVVDGLPLSLLDIIPQSSLFADKRFARGLGTLGGKTSYAEKISGDGRVIVGRSINAQGHSEAFRWADGQMIGLGIPAADFKGYSASFAASADGAVIVGQYSNAQGIVTAFRWTLATGIVCVSPNPTQPFYINTISSDGRFTVGNFHTGETYLREGFAAPIGLGNALRPDKPFFDIANETSNFSNANSISANGSVLAGCAKSECFSGEAFMWTQATGMVGLGALPGASFSQSTAISADGKVIVGTSGDRFRQAFRWTAADGMLGLGFLKGQSTHAQSVSCDGSLIVGYTHAADAAFIWDAHNGMRDLQDVLIEMGLAEGLEGWRLTQAQAISEDGRTITGVGINPEGNEEAWVAKADWLSVDLPAIERLPIAL